MLLVEVVLALEFSRRFAPTSEVAPALPGLLLLAGTSRSVRDEVEADNDGGREVGAFALDDKACAVSEEEL